MFDAAYYSDFERHVAKVGELDYRKLAKEVVLGTHLSVGVRMIMMILP